MKKSNLIKTILVILLIIGLIVIFVMLGKGKKDNEPINDKVESFDNGALYDADRLINTQYEQARKIYNSIEPFQTDGDVVTNYNVVMMENFTDAAKAKYESENIFIKLNDEGIPVLTEAEFNTTFVSVEFKDVEVTEEKITTIAVTKTITDKEETQENKFTLVKIEGVWLIDEYTNIM